LHGTLEECVRNSSKKKVKKFIDAKKIQFFTILETQLKVNSINKDCDWLELKLNRYDGNPQLQASYELKQRLFEVQSKLDVDPFNKNLKERSIKIGKVYIEEAEDELKIRKNKSKVETISKEDGSRVFGEKVTDEEIKAALFDIDSSKAAGPHRKIPREINATLIALVPKIDNPYKVSNFRLIACCNVLYKCISKILTSKIKDGLSKVVSLNHSAFILGRHIQDNILISHEILKGYNRKNGAKRCAIKIDIQKACDIVNCDFLRNSLLLVGFHEVMFNWIMTCISTTSYSICINGEVCCFFKGGRGLRQGDPLSPYLFTFVMEVFNMITINNIVAAPSFKYHYGCKELKLIHMCFADDLMVLCNGDKESLKVVKKSLEEPKEQGGLGIKHLKKWTELLLISQIGRLLKERSLYGLNG
ncbi:RNA-directed DNA polymerase, eukaryota, reverse transcriptase zinc-binding domain protein, partial [Tanacetum coccineum]